METNGWTGGQYSLVRVALGCTMAFNLATAGVVPTPLWDLLNLSAFGFDVVTGMGLVACLFLAAGLYDRWAALFLCLTFPMVPTETFFPSVVHPYVFLLVVHVLLPPAPYGSWTAINRVDPGGGWLFPPRLAATVWLFVGAMWVAASAGFLMGAKGSDAKGVGLALAAFALLAINARTRPLAWLGFALLSPLLQFWRLWDDPLPFLMLHLLAFGPRWIPARLSAGREYVFYDGGCGLCHRAIRFVLAEDKAGQLFTLAPLQGQAFLALVDAETRAGLPDSLVVRTDRGAILTRSEAVLRIGLRLGGFWRPLAMIGVLIPRVLRDGLYGAVAVIRHRLFPSPKDLCPILPPELRARFEV